MRDSTDTDLWDSLGFLLGVTSRKASLLLTHRLRSFGLSPEQWSVLTLVREREGLIQKEIAERSGRDRPTVTRILDALEAKGFVVKQAGIEDRRSFRVYATEAGREIADRTRPIERRSNQDLLEGLGADGYGELKRLLLVLNGHADKLLDREGEEE